MTYKIALFRGSFDPPHMGHVFAALQASCTLDVHDVCISPVFNHPFGKKLSDFKIRYEMCQLAFSSIKDCVVTDDDMHNPTGHCIDLLKYIKKKNGEEIEIVMLGGSDVNSQNDKYKDKEEILKLCTIARVPRSSYSDNKYAIPNYSSSEIKQLIQEFKSIQGLVPKKVESYIERHGLYRKKIIDNGVKVVE